MPSAVYLNDALESPASGDFSEHSIDFCSCIKLLALQMVFFEIINVAMCSMRVKQLCCSAGTTSDRFLLPFPCWTIIQLMHLQESEQERK